RSLADGVRALWPAPWGSRGPADGYGQAIADAVQDLVVTRLIDLASSAAASPQVRADAAAGLRRIRTMAAAPSPHAVEARETITRFLTRPADTFRKTDPLATPPGEPIGGP